MQHLQRSPLSQSSPGKELDHLQPLQAIRQDTGETIWLVQSRATPGHYYLLTVDNDTIQCPCQQFRYRGGCAHVGAVRVALPTQQSLSASGAHCEESQSASQPTPRGFSHPKPRNEQERRQFEAADQRERALPWTDDRPFSIWK